MSKKPLIQIENRRYSISRSPGFKGGSLMTHATLPERDLSATNECLQRQLGIQPDNNHPFNGTPEGGPSIYYDGPKRKP